MSSSNAASNIIPMRDFDRPAPQQAVQFERLLQECRQVAIERLSESLAAMLDKADEALRELASGNTDREARDLYSKARDKALTQRRAIQDQFRDKFVAESDRRIHGDRTLREQFSQYDLSSLELGLVADDDLEETLKVNDMAAKLRRYCEEELTALDQRVAVLVGDANLQAEGNPFSPQAICLAFKQTCREIEPELKVRMVFHKLFDDHVLDDVRSIYKDLNALLVQRSILPKIRFGSARRPGSSAGTPGADLAEGVQAESARAVPGGGEQDFFSMLQNLHAVTTGKTLGASGTILPQGMPVLHAGANVAQIPGFPPILSGGSAPVILQAANLLNALTRIQHGDLSALGGSNPPLAATLLQPGTANVLHELKQTNVTSAMGQMDAMTLDIVAMLFDEIFDDEKIPVAMKGLIGRLQIPTLKVALLDKTFFSRRDHPTRLLLESLGEIGLGLPSEFDHESSLYQQIEAVLQKLIDGFREEIGIFDELRGELERVIAEQNQRAEEEAARMAKSIEEKERLEVAKVAAQNEIRQRAETAEIPRSVRKFLAEQWVKLLLIAHAKNGPDSDQWKTAVATMDLLIWSVNPGKSLDERRQLASKLPGLLKRINAGMQTIRLEEPARRQFFVKLMRCHTQIINGRNASTPSGNAQPGAAQAAPSRQAPPVSPIASTQPSAPASTRVSPGAPAAAAPHPLAPAPAGVKPGAPASASAAPVTPAAAPAIAATAANSKPAAPAPMAATPASRAPARAATASPEAPEEDDQSLDFTEVATPEFSAVRIQNPFGDGEIEVEEISLSEASARQGSTAGAGSAGPADEYLRMASGLKEGAWVEFRGEQDRWHSARLSYISQTKGTYLFVNRQGRKIGEYSLNQLARELRSRRAAVLDNAPLFDRAMTGLVGVLKGGRPNP